MKVVVNATIKAGKSNNGWIGEIYFAGTQIAFHYNFVSTKKELIKKLLRHAKATPLMQYIEEKL